MNRFFANVLGGGAARRTPNKARRLRLDSLEDRSVPATFIVTTAADNAGGVNPTAGAGTGTLRQAIVDANATTEADTIVFDAAGVFATPQTINLEAILPTIVTAGGGLTITGTGVDNLTVRRSASAATQFRVLTSTATAASPLTMTDFTITGGNTASTSTVNGGAGLRAAGLISLDRMRITGNTSGVAGGAIRVDTGGALSLKNSTVSGNTASTSGGGIYFFDGGSLVIENSTISGNTSGGNGGGAIYFYGTTAAAPPVVAELLASVEFRMTRAFAVNPAGGAAAVVP